MGRERDLYTALGILLVFIGGAPFSSVSVSSDRVIRRPRASLTSGDTEIRGLAQAIAYRSR